MTLIQHLSISREMGFPDQDVFAERVNGVPCFSRGRGTRAARRAGRICAMACETGRYPSQFNALLRVSRGLQ